MRFLKLFFKRYLEVVMTFIKSIFAACVFACAAQSACAQVNATNYGEMVSVSTSYFDFSSISEVDKRRFRAVKRRAKFRKAVKRIRSKRNRTR